MAKRFLVLIALLMLGFYVAGCAEGDDSASVVNPNPDVVEFTGSISGVVMDICASAPIEDAVVSVAYSGSVHSVTTGSTGAFSFNNVPANWVAGSDLDFGADDGYFVTCDLTGNDDYGYAWVEEVWVAAGDLNDGDNYAMDDAESGSGADTPVNKLANGLIFELAPLNASISGTIYDLSTGMDATAATVSLYYNGMLVATPVSTTTGAYSFTDLMPGIRYYVMVTKAGYDYVEYDWQSDAIDTDDEEDYVSCGAVQIACAPACNQALAGQDVYIEYDPARDVTRPYITSIEADDSGELWEGDEALDFQVEEFVVTFSEAMRTTHNIKAAIDVTSSFALTVTCNGANATDLAESYELIDDYTVSMTSAGVMTIAIDYLAAADVADIRNDAAIAAWPDDVTLAITAADGGYAIEFAVDSPFLTDTSLNPWSYAEHDGWKLSSNVWIQWFILGASDDNEFEIDAAF